MNVVLKKILKLGAVIAVGLTFLSGCDQPTIGITEEIHEGKGKGFFAQCIAADDFGFPKSPVVPSHPEINEILGEREDQTSYWLDTGLVSDGNDLLVQASGTWTSWFNGNFEAPISAAQDEKYCILNWDTDPGNIFTCEATGMPIYSTTHENRSIYMNVNSSDFNAPCWFTHGYSGYLLFMPETLGAQADPNNPDILGVGDPVAMKYPIHPTMHLFGWNDRNCGSFFNSNPDPAARNYSGEYCGGDYAVGDIVLSEMYQPLPREDGAQAGDRLWVRIADRYYEDNDGFYVFTFKRGARTPGQGPIESIINFVTDRIFGSDGQSGLARQLYEEVIADTTFQRVVLISLLLYIILTGYTFIIRGRMSQGEFVARILKFSVITVLIQPGSWDFFYDYLFNVFIRGTYDLIDIVVGAAVGTPSGLSGEYVSATLGADDATRGTQYNVDSRGPQYFDDLIDIFFSPETMAKIHASLFYGGGIGVFVLAAFYFALGVFLYIMIRLVIVYLLGVIPMGILIIIAPLFILFMLFDFTRRYFQNWISQMLSAALQLFMASAMLALISAVMLDYLQQTAGYRVCWKCWWCPRIDFGFIQDFAYAAAFIGILPPPDPDRDKYLLWFLAGTSGSEPNGFKFWLPDIRHDTALYLVDEVGYRARQRYYDEYYPGYMGYVYLDWDRDGDLELNFRNPLDLPYYDPADTNANSQRGRVALNYKLSGNLLTVPDVLVFILVLLVFLIFSQQVTGIAMGLANVIYGINYGDAAGNMLRTGRQIGGAFLSKLSSSTGSATSGARRAIRTRAKGAAGSAAGLLDWEEGLSQSTADLRDEYEQLRRDELNAIKRETAADLDQAALQRRERGRMLATEMEGNRVNRDQYEARRQEELRGIKRENINDMEDAMFRSQRRGKILSDEMNENRSELYDDMAAAQSEGESIKRLGKYHQGEAAYLRELRGERLADEMKDNKFILDNDVMRNQNNQDKTGREGQFDQDMAQARREYRGVRLASEMDQNLRDSEFDRSQNQERLREVGESTKFDAERAAKLRDVRQKLLTAELTDIAKENIKGMDGLDEERAAKGRVKMGLSTGQVADFKEVSKIIRMTADKKEKQVKQLAQDVNAVNKALANGGGVLELSDLNDRQRALYDRMVDEAAVSQGLNRFGNDVDKLRAEYGAAAAKELGRGASDVEVLTRASRMAGLDQVSDDQDLLLRNLKDSRDEIIRQEYEELEKGFIADMKTTVGTHFGGSLKNQEAFEQRVAEKYRELAVDDLDVMQSRLGKADGFIATRDNSIDKDKTLAKELKGANDNMGTGTGISVTQQLSVMNTLSDLDVPKNASKDEIINQLQKKIDNDYKGKDHLVAQATEMRIMLQQQQNALQEIQELDSQRIEIFGSRGRLKTNDRAQVGQIMASKKAFEAQLKRIDELRNGTIELDVDGNPVKNDDGSLKRLDNGAYGGVGRLLADKDELKRLDKLESRLRSNLSSFDSDIEALKDQVRADQRRKSNNSDSLDGISLGFSGKHNMTKDQIDRAQYARFRELGLETLDRQQNQVLEDAVKKAIKYNIPENQREDYYVEQLERYGLTAYNQGVSFEEASRLRHLKGDAKGEAGKNFNDPMHVLNRAVGDYEKAKSKRDQVAKDVSESQKMMKELDSSIADIIAPPKLTPKESLKQGLTFNKDDANVKSKNLLKQGLQYNKLKDELRTLERLKQSPTLSEGSDIDSVIREKNDAISEAKEAYEKLRDKAINQSATDVANAAYLLDTYVASASQIREGQRNRLMDLRDSNESLDRMSAALKMDIKYAKNAKDSALLIADQDERKEYKDKLDSLQYYSDRLDVMRQSDQSRYSKLVAKHASEVEINGLSAEDAQAKLEKVINQLETRKQGENVQEGHVTTDSAKHVGKKLNAEQGRADSLGLGSKIAATYKEISHLESLQQDLEELTKAGVPVQHKLVSVRQQLLDAHGKRNSIHTEMQKEREAADKSEREQYIRDNYKVMNEERRASADLEEMRMSYAKSYENNRDSLKEIMKTSAKDRDDASYNSLVTSLDKRDLNTSIIMEGMKNRQDKVIDLQQKQVDKLDAMVRQSKEEIEEQRKRMAELQKAVASKQAISQQAIDSVPLYSSEALSDRVKQNAKANQGRQELLNDFKTASKLDNEKEIRESAKQTLGQLSKDIRTLERNRQEVQNELEQAKLTLSTAKLKAAAEENDLKYGNDKDRYSTVSALSQYADDLEKQITKDTRTANVRNDEGAKDRLEQNQKQLEEVRNRLEAYEKAKTRQSEELAHMRDAHKRQVDRVQTLNSKGSNKSFTDGRDALELKRNLAGGGKDGLERTKIFGKNTVLSDAKAASSMADSSLNERSRIHDFTSSSSSAFENMGTGFGRAYKGAKGATYDAIKGGPVGVMKTAGSSLKGAPSQAARGMKHAAEDAAYHAGEARIAAKEAAKAAGKAMRDTADAASRLPGQAASATMAAAVDTRDAMARAGKDTVSAIQDTPQKIYHTPGNIEYTVRGQKERAVGAALRTAENFRTGSYHGFSRAFESTGGQSRSRDEKLRANYESNQALEKIKNESGDNRELHIQKLREEYNSKFKEEYTDLDGNTQYRDKQEPASDILHRGRLERELRQLNNEIISDMDKDIIAQRKATEEKYEADHGKDNEIKEEIAKATGKGIKIDVSASLTDNIEKHNQYAKEKINHQLEEVKQLENKIGTLKDSWESAATEGERNLLHREMERKENTLAMMQQEHYKEQVRDAEETAEALYRTYKQLHTDISGNAGSINKDDILHDVLEERNITETWKKTESGSPSVSIDGSAPSVSTGFASMDKWEDKYNSLDELNKALLNDKEYAYKEDELAAVYRAQEERKNESFTDIAKKIFGEEEANKTSGSARKTGALRQISALQERLRRKEYRKSQDASNKAVLESEISEIESQIQMIKDTNGL